MRGFVDNRSYSFITAYLLGVEHKVLKRDYVEDYVYSEGLELFNQVENARTLRALSRVKQGIFRNYDMFKTTNSLEDTARGYIDYDLDYLLEQDIDLYNEYKQTLSIPDLLNGIQGRIDKMLRGVLEIFKYKHIEQIESLFYLYPLTKKSLNRLMLKVKDKAKKFPHGIVIIKGTKVLQHLPYILQKDKNLFLSSYAITNTPYDVNTLEIPEFDWSWFEGSKPTPILPITQGSNIYVDCDNTDFFMFLSLMDSLEKSLSEGEQHHVKLYLDNKTSPIWQFTDKVLPFSTQKILFENIDVKRVKDEKSVVDLVITSHMTRESLTSDRPLGIISSDSDFFGLSEVGLDFFVLYDASCTNREYINYLNRRKMLNFDISTLITAESKLEKRDLILTYLCLSYLPTMPMHEWTSENLTESILAGFGKEVGYGIEIIGGELTILTKRVLSNLQVESKELALKLTSGDVELEVDLKTRAG